jgi:hypothetical protein
MDRLSNKTTHDKNGTQRGQGDEQGYVSGGDKPKSDVQNHLRTQDNLTSAAVACVNFITRLDTKCLKEVIQHC